MNTKNNVAGTGSQPLLELSNAMVSLHREHFGRGPAAAKAAFAGNLAVCTLTDVFTRSERRLIEAGRGEHVQITRLLHQATCEEEYIEAAARALGRPVRAMVSAPHIDLDLLFEVFVLGEPENNASGGGGDA